MALLSPACIEILRDNMSNCLCYIKICQHSEMTPKLANYAGSVVRITKSHWEEFSNICFSSFWIFPSSKRQKIIYQIQDFEANLMNVCMIGPNICTMRNAEYKSFSPLCSFSSGFYNKIGLPIGYKAPIIGYRVNNLLELTW